MIYAYLNIPPPVPCPRLINKMFETFTIVLVQALGVPHKVRLEERIVEKVHCPIPEQAEVYFKLELLLSMINSNNLFLKLFNMQPQLSVCICREIKWNHLLVSSFWLHASRPRSHHDEIRESISPHPWKFII